MLSAQLLAILGGLLEAGATPDLVVSQPGGHSVPEAIMMERRE